jgi:hypothetical protein
MLLGPGPGVTSEEAARTHRSLAPRPAPREIGALQRGKTKFSKTELRLARRARFGTSME